MVLLLWYPLFFFSPPKTCPILKKKQNVLVKAISVKRRLRFWVKCGGNQLNAEIKGERDGGQICQLLKSYAPSLPPDLMPHFNYPCHTISLLTSSSVDLTLSHLNVQNLLFLLSVKCSKWWQNSFSSPLALANRCCFSSSPFTAFVSISVFCLSFLNKTIPLSPSVPPRVYSSSK